MQKQALIVAGAHRSGTSALARMLSLLGAALPTTLMGAGAGNPEGHWEPIRIVDANTELLAEIGSCWDDSRALPPDWSTSPAAIRFTDRAAGLIAEEYGAAPLIMIKDPRICRLVPIYRPALERAGFAMKFILPVRHPGEVVASLQARDGMDPRRAELLWLRHLLEAEAASRDSPRVWTGYAELLTDWDRLQARIATALGLVWPFPADAVAGDISAFINPALRHFQAGSATAPGIGPLARRLWTAARNGIAGDEAGLRRTFDVVRGAVDDLDRLSAAQAEQQQVRTNELAAANQRLTAELHAAAAALQQARDALAPAVSPPPPPPAAEFEPLRRQLASAEAQLDAIKRSRSWRLTEPGRLIGRLARQVAGR